MIRKWLIERATRTPYWHIDDYMGRYWLFGGSARDDRGEDARGWYRSALDAWIGRRIAGRLHYIRRSDPDRNMHDHPWWSVSIVLQGGYWEVMPLYQYQHPAADRTEECQKVKWRGPGSVVFRRATDRHRLVIPQEQTTATVSLFIMGPKTNEWGFYTKDGKVPWWAYLGIDPPRDG